MKNCILTQALAEKCPPEQVLAARTEHPNPGEPVPSRTSQLAVIPFTDHAPQLVQSSVWIASGPWAPVIRKITMNILIIHDFFAILSGGRTLKNPAKSIFSQAKANVLKPLNLCVL
jgi:hypothetical protein